MCTAKGSDVRPGVPWGSASFAWQAWDNVRCQGVGCTPWRPLGLRRFCVAGVGLTHSLTPSLPHSLIHSLTAALAWQAWDNARCQQVGCTPWRFFWGSAAFAWQAWFRRFSVAGVGQCALPRGRMYALASLGAPPLLRGRRGTMCTAKGSDVRPGVPWGSAAFAWQAWDNVRCQGVGCTPWRPLGLHLFCVAGVGQCALPRGRMYALASLGAPSLCVAGVGQCALPRGRMYALASLGAPPLLCGRRGTMCTAKGSDVRPGVPWGSAAFAWQAWDNVRCQGVGCTPWRPLGLRLFCVADVGQSALPRGRMYALASLGAPSLCVAGVGQCALPRGRMYALASLGAPPLLCGRRGTTAFAWQALDNVHRQEMYAVRFLILLPSSYSSARPPTHTHITHSSLTHIHSHIITLTHSHSISLTHHAPHTHTHSHTHTLISHTHTHSLHHSSPTHPHTLRLPAMF